MKKYNVGGSVKSAIKKKVNTALKQRSTVRAAGARAKGDAVVAAGNKAAKAAGEAAEKKANTKRFDRAKTRYQRRKAGAQDAIQKGNVGKAARLDKRADIRGGRDVAKNDKRKAAAKAKAVKRVATKTSNMASRAYAQAERREDRANKYVGGGKVVAQGADKKDVRSEKKQDRAKARATRKTRNKNYRRLKKDIRTGKLNPYVDNMKG
jgi:hypothetical protein